MMSQRQVTELQEMALCKKSKTARNATPEMTAGRKFWQGKVSAHIPRQMPLRSSPEDGLGMNMDFHVSHLIKAVNFIGVERQSPG
jgi:hypothetical protein